MDGAVEANERISVTIENGVADVRLVRTDKMNALDQPMFEALVAATERLSKEKGLRAVVLSGEGKAFCAGLDMGSFAAMKEQADKETVPGARDLTALRKAAEENAKVGGGGRWARNNGGGERTR